MSTLKNKIEELQSKTTSTAVYNACNEALRKMENNKAYVAVNESELEDTILTNLLESINTTDIKDSAASSFVSEKDFEVREDSLSNMGIAETFEALSNADIAKHPAFSYAFGKIVAESANKPEWRVIESVIAVLTPFNWEPLVNEKLKVLVENADKFREDIAIHKIVEGMQSSNSRYLYTGIVTPLESYLKNRTSADRVTLMEAASKFLFDPNMKALYNFLGESQRSFHIAANDNSCSINNIYSPVSISENCEYFVAEGKVYKKEGEVISVANEEEFNSLPTSFKAVADILSWSNVTISEGSIKIWAGDKKIQLVEENSNPVISINGAVVTKANVHRSFLNSGVFRMNENVVIGAINVLAENWNTIFEMDFAKSITSKADTSKKMTVFFIGENIFINKVNTILKEDVFYTNCNATQTKNLVMEYMKFDISSSFNALLNEEEKQLSEAKALKNEYLQAISMLTDRKSRLESVPTDIRETAEVKELILALDEEISHLKEEYSKVTTAELSVTKVDEGMGFNVGDEAELGKKK